MLQERSDSYSSGGFRDNSGRSINKIHRLQNRSFLNSDNIVSQRLHVGKGFRNWNTNPNSIRYGMNRRVGHQCTCSP